MGIEGDFRILARRGCENPPCVRVCHTDGLEMKPEGRVVFHKEKCTNCGKCEKACLICAIPKGSEGMPIKCIHCGGCVAFCPPRGAQARRGRGLMAAFRKVVYIDHTKGESWIEERPEPYDQWLGGTGTGTQLMMEEYPQGTDPLSPQAPIILKAGPLNGIFPTITKGISHFKSPLTGEWGESYAGGRLALAMRFAKAEPIVVRGASESPCYISINDAKIEIKDVTSIWGVDARTTMVISREHEPGVGRRSIIRIGPAGENLVRIANVVVDTYRHMGMLGIGAIFGSKKRKAIVISGTEHAETLDPKKYREAYNKIHNTAVQTDVTRSNMTQGPP